MRQILLFICLGIISIFFIGCDQATQQTQNTSNTGREDVIEAPEEMPQDFPEETQQDVTENTKEEAIVEAEVEDDKGKGESLPDVFEPGIYTLTPVFEELEFRQPLYLTADYANSPYVYVVEKQGLVKRIHTSDASMDIFIDLTTVVDSTENETGLLGLAFHPNYPEDPRFFVYYTQDDFSKLVEYQVKPDASNQSYTVMDATAKLILEFEQPYVNHNGGHIAFGPDGYLYIASGDGGAGGDPDNNAQNLQNLLGKILRIDINEHEEGLNYGIPQDNPFVGQDRAREEIYAYGLRNPWKFSFDDVRELMLVADVGQDAVEEINHVENGGNYGWSHYEGDKIYNDNIPLAGKVVAPLYSYDHGQGQSITGGYTYYGQALASLHGVYVYGDFMSGKLWGLWLDVNRNAENVHLLDTDLRIASFGLDGMGELYILDFRGGVYQLQEVEQ